MEIEEQIGSLDATMAKEKPKAAFAYLRTSSAANVGADKDSAKRQREAIASFAKRAGYEILAEYPGAMRE